MSKFLSPSECSDLIFRHKLERDKRVCDRIKVILWSDEGLPAEVIASLLYIDDATVRRYLNEFKKSKILTPNHKGSEPILSTADSIVLSTHLEETCYLKVKEIQDFIRRTFNKEMAISTITAWLEANDFSYKKPKLVPRADAALQDAFIELYEKTLNKAAEQGDPVLFSDCAHPSQQTRPSYGWIKKGKDKIIDVTNGRKRMNIMGAINLETMKFEYETFEKTINSESTICFLKKVEATYKDRKVIYIIFDNAGYYKSEEVQEYLKTSRIQALYLPPRSPNLNAIERLWKVMHEYVSNNRVHKDFRAFKNAVLDFFDNTIPSIFEVLVNRITDNFQPISCAK